MCGIFALENYHDSLNIHDYWNKTQHRGPDNSTSLVCNNNFFGFHRLAINGLNESGNQPFDRNDVILCCNGEIYNSQELKQKYNIETFGNSDCEVILHLYKKFGIFETIRLLSGYFAFVLYDKKEEKYFVGRDPFGVRSLFYGKTVEGNYAWSSEIKSLVGLVLPETIQCFPTGHFWSSSSQEFTSYYSYQYNLTSKEECFQQEAMNKVYSLLEDSVQKRFMTERPFGVLLSGGLDSCIIAALVAKFSSAPIHTFSIGLPGSPDLKYAKIMAKHLGSVHHEVIVQPHEMLSAIRRVIYMIESYDVTTVRASIPMFLLAEYIYANTNIKVIFSGEGSDELSGSYLYFKNAPSPQEFHKESVRLVKDLCFFDCLRCDKSTASWGLEVRCPFLDKEFVDYYMTIPTEWKLPPKNIEKWFLRKSLDRDNLLPTEILWRRKEAFSDGVSPKEKSWYEIIQDYTEEYYTAHGESSYIPSHNPPPNDEAKFYREMFDRFYPKCEKVIPYYWMPKWSEGVSDPSARCLENYDC